MGSNQMRSLNRLVVVVLITNLVVLSGYKQIGWDGVARRETN